MRIGSLFSGAGMLDEGVRSVLGGTVAWHAEVDPAACRVLAHRYPDVPNLGDVTAADWTAVEPVDVLTGGSPCQDVSHAGKRAGMRAGTRSGLWAAMCDAIDILRPRLVVWENVRGVLSAEADSGMEPCPGCVGGADDGAVLRALGRVLGDLAGLGYDTRWCGLRAADVGAPHGRFRVFVVAWPAAASATDAGSEAVRVGPGLRASEPRGQRRRRPDDDGVPGAAADADVAGLEGHRGLLTAPRENETAAQHRSTGGSFPERGLVQVDQFDTVDSGRVGDGVRVGRPVTRHQVSADSGKRIPDGLLNVTQRAVGCCGGEHGESSHDSDCSSRHQEVNTPAAQVAWGPYKPAIRRWERTLGRPAPAPTETAPRGGQRLSPRFVEWLMGWPEGWVTDVPGVTRNDQLKICGNGVVPQQAAEALRRMLNAEQVAA